jgi:hypothetical protein
MKPIHIRWRTWIWSPLFLAACFDWTIRPIYRCGAQIIWRNVWCYNVTTSSIWRSVYSGTRPRRGLVQTPRGGEFKRMIQLNMIQPSARLKNWWPQNKPQKWCYRESHIWLYIYILYVVHNIYDVIGKAESLNHPFWKPRIWGSLDIIPNRGYTMVYPISNIFPTWGWFMALALPQPWIRSRNRTWEAQGALTWFDHLTHDPRTSEKWECGWLDP